MSGPYKCPECGVWWVGVEHRCQIAHETTANPPTPTITWPTITTTSVTSHMHRIGERCQTNCPPTPATYRMVMQ